MARDKITNHREAVNIVTCPVMRSLLVLGGKWKLLLLYLLAFESKGGHLRYSDFVDSQHLRQGALLGAQGVGGRRADYPYHVSRDPAPSGIHLVGNRRRAGYPGSASHPHFRRTV